MSRRALFDTPEPGPRAPEGFVCRADRFVAVREGWRRRPNDAGSPYRAQQQAGALGAWIVVDRSGKNCWVRDSGQTTDSRRQVAEAVAAAWNDEAHETFRGMR